MDKLPLFDISLEDIAQGMYKISLVDKPAIEEDFIHFNEVEKVQMFADEKKKEVVGPIMIPNKEILRFSAQIWDTTMYDSLKRLFSRLCTSILRRDYLTHLALTTPTILMRWLCLKFGPKRVITISL